MNSKHQDPIKESDSPESGGDPIAETDMHAQLMRDLRFALNSRFRDDDQVYIGINAPMYWVKGDGARNNAPDVFVAFGVPKEPQREAWKMWEEGKAPDVIFEVSSRKTWREDFYEKWRVYERIGVREYFIFDPQYDYLPEPLIAWRLVDKQFVSQPVDDGVYYSEILGLEIVDTGETLRLRDPGAGRYLLTEGEEIAARQKAENRVKQAEAEVEWLQKELAGLRRPDTKKGGGKK
jgi:Uma2 family endonuclease